MNAWGVKKGVARWQALLALAVVALAAALAAWLALKGFSPSPGAVEKPVQFLASIEVEGRGSVLANGTSKLLWDSTKPFTLLLEAKPERCWSFKGWLVNGSSHGAELNVTLTVKGNTTVKAVFELPVYTVLIAPVLPEQAERASALVNGTPYQLPAVVNAPACSLLEIEPMAPRGWRALNGTVTLLVDRNAVVKLFFEKAVARVELRGVIVPVLVNGTLVANDTVLELPYNSTMYVEPFGVDDAGCVPFNRTHKICLTGWLRETTGEELRVRYLYLNVTGSEILKQLVVLVKANYTGAAIEVAVGNTLAWTVAEPSKTLLIPFDAKYEYVGNGWFHVKGKVFAFYVKMPPWRKLKVYVNYTAKTTYAEGRALQAPAYLTVVVRNGPVYLSVGVYLTTIPTTVFTFDRRLVEIYNNALEKCSFERKCMESFFGREADFYRLVACYNLAEGGACSLTKVMKGPSERLEPGNWGPGDFHFEGEGEMWIKIEVVE